MTILHLVDSGGVYGAEVVILSLITHQRRRGHDARLVSIGTPGEAEKPLEAAAEARGLPVERVRMRPGANPAGALQLWRLARERGAAVVHSHGYKPDILCGFVPRRFRGACLVATLHGYTHGSRLMAAYQWLDRKALRRCDAVVLVHHGMLTDPTFASLHRDRLRVIENGLPDADPDGPAPDAGIIEFCRRGPVVGAVGRLSAEKGFDGLVRALARLPAATRLVVLGEGPERARLAGLAASLGAEDRLLMPGFVPARSYLPHFDVFALPSHTEGLPISLLEAMAAGRPIVASRVGGIPYVLDDGRAGRLVPPGDEAALVTALSELLGDPSAAGRLGAAALGRSRDFSTDAMGDGYLALYADVIERGCA